MTDGFDPTGANATLQQGVDLQSQKFNDAINQARTASTAARPRDFGAELQSGIESYRGDERNQVMQDKMPQMDWMQQQLRGMEGNPFAMRMMQNLMFQKMAQGQADRVYDRGLADRRQDTALAQDIQADQFATTTALKARQLAQAGFTLSKTTLPNGMEQRVWLNRETGESKLEGDPYDPNIKSVAAQAQFLAGKEAGKPNYFAPLGLSGGQPPVSETAQTGIPINPTKPWQKVPARDQGKFQAATHTKVSAMLEKNRAALEKTKTMTDSLERFQYLNNKQNKEAEDDYFGTKTGSFVDRITDFSLDEDKREMVRITNLLTPQMRQGLPGAASDRDVALFRGATVGIDASKDINDAVIQGMTVRLQNANDRQSFMEEYFNANGHIDGAEIKWKEYLEKNPIFDHSEGMRGSYTKNKNRLGYKDYFRSQSGGSMNRRNGDKFKGWSVNNG